MATRTGFGRRQYRAYVPHLLEGWEPALTAEDVDAVTVADRALVAAGTLPRSELAGGLARWMLARDESIRSSVIEGVAATASGLAWAEYQDQAGKPVSDENDALTLGASQQIAAAVELGQRMRSGYRASLDDLSAVSTACCSHAPATARWGACCVMSRSGSARRAAWSTKPCSWRRPGTVCRR